MNGIVKDMGIAAIAAAFVIFEVKELWWLALWAITLIDSCANLDSPNRKPEI